MDNDEVKARRDRQEGRAPNGTVDLRSFDEGVALTLRAQFFDVFNKKTNKEERNLYVPDVPQVTDPPGFPGIPIIFSFPEDVVEVFKIPSIVLSQDSLDAALQRWHPGSFQYRAPMRGSLPAQVGDRLGATHYETMPQAVPYDFTYSLTLYAKNRNEGNALTTYVLRIFPPYCNVKVRDSIGDMRLYSAFNESVGPLDDASEVGDRVVARAITLRVEGELDLNDPTIQRAVERRVTRLRTKKGERDA